MKQIGSNYKSMALVAILLTTSALAYQNCSSATSFSASENLNSLVDDSIPIVPNFATKIAGDSESFPPLKLIFVVDNSGTMEVNQINLSNAFDRMFVGSNATNLAPFDTTAFVISTAQNSPDKTSAVFSRLPTQTAESFGSLPINEFQANRGSTLSGLIPGDLVGYGLATTTTAERTVTSFYPAPVALFRPGIGGSTAVSRFSHKSQNGSVDTFSADFKERLAILNPTKSAIDPTTTRGVLDDVVDKESGLCGVARVLRNNAGFVNPGDLASIIIVSDENDADPSGRSCYDSIIEAKSGVNYVDGRCEATQTNLIYRAENENPAKAKCKVDYQTGFAYRVDYKNPTVDVTYFTKAMKYDQLQTDVSYYTKKQEYNQRRTNVTYFTSKMMYDKIQTPVTYYTKNPTYTRPQTNVKYFTEVENCTIRDGIKTNCTYTYPSFNTTLVGAFNNQCATFVNGKLPNGALYSKAGYLPVCTAGSPTATISGACSATDNTILDCKQNYSSPVTTQLAGKVSTTCDAYVAGRLPSGTLYSAANDPGYAPSCGTLIVTSDQTGNCSVSDTDKQNCRTVYTQAATAAMITGVRGAATCNAFALNRLPSGAVYGVDGYLPTCVETTAEAKTGTCSTNDTNVTDCRTTFVGPVKLTVAGRASSGACESTFKSKLPSGAVFGDSAHPVTCENGATLANRTGNCSTTDTNVANCQTVYTQASTKSNLEGAISTTCDAFVAGRLPSGAVYTDAGYQPSCAVGTSKDKNVTGSELYSKWPNFTATINGACSDDVRNSIVTARGLVVAPSTTPVCKVTSIASASQTLSDTNSDLMCTVAPWREVCSESSDARRGCTATDIAAGEKYAANTTTKTYEGQFACDTLCSKTSFCKDKMGTVGDNHYQCQTTAGSPLVKSTFTLEPETSICKTNESRIVTKGPYKTTETKPSYVAATKSEANSSTALADMIVERSREIFKDSLPIVSVFVRQPGDTLGTNGSLGTEYNRLADMLGGKKLSVLSTSNQYASALEDLSSQIRTRLGQSVSFREVQSNQEIRRVWLKIKGTTNYKLVEGNLWSASGGTITLSKDLVFTYGDEFKIEYW